MKVRMTPLTVALSLFAATAYAADPNLGTWRLNESKSKIPAGTGKNTKVVYEQTGESFEATIDGVDNEGKPTHTEWTGKIDGKDYLIVGDRESDTRALKKVDNHHYTFVSKKDGKVTDSGKVVFSKDYKTRTIEVSWKDKDGRPVSGTLVFEKQ